MLDWLWEAAPQLAATAAATATAALWWPDEMVGKAAAFCRCSGSARLYNEIRVTLLAAAKLPNYPPPVAGLGSVMSGSHVTEICSCCVP